MINMIILIKLFLRIDIHHGSYLELLNVSECKIKILFLIVGEENNFFLYSLRFCYWDLQITLTKTLTGTKAYKLIN